MRVISCVQCVKAYDVQYFRQRYDKVICTLVNKM